MDANLLEALNRQGRKGCLEDMIVYGRVRCAIGRPYVVGSNLQTVPTGAFAILDAYALKCQGIDYFAESGVGNSNSVYFTKGSMVIYVDSEDWVGKDVKVMGTSMKRGVKIRQQFNHKTPQDGITAFAFSRQGDSYVVVPNAMVELCENESDFRMTPLEDFIIKLKQQEDGVIEYPVTLDSIMSYEGASEYTELEHIEGSSKQFVVDEERVDLTKVDLHLTYHLYGKSISPYYEDVKAEISEMSDKRKEYSVRLGELIKEKMNEDTDPGAFEAAKAIRNNFIQNIVKNLAVNVGKSTIKGRYYVDEFVSHLVNPPVGLSREESQIDAKSLKASVGKLTNMIIADYTTLYNSSVSDEDEPIPILEDDRQFALLVIAISTGIDYEVLKSNYTLCHRTLAMDFYCWFYALLNYPYVIGLIGSLSIVDCDIIYLSYTKCFTSGSFMEENKQTRLDLIYLQTLEHCSDKNTLINKTTLAKAQAYYPNRGNKFLTDNFFPAKKDTVEVLNTICGSNLRLSTKGLAQFKGMKWYDAERTKDLMEKGIVNEVDSKLMLERDLEKEFLIYDTLIQKGKAITGITDDQVERTIEEFEGLRGFSLESLQRDGIKLCKFKAGVLSGCAGSGKTTTSDCMTMCLTNNLKNYKIVYGTPTGKACRRLAEVVHGTVKTLHSQFGVGMFGESYLADVKKKQRNPKDERHVYLLDEMAMCNTSLLYEVVRSLTEEDIIYFLGDIKQLPPIGKGNPFYLLMQILPCVELGVSKRAAEGSLVNYNTTLINCLSDGVVHELAYDESSFFCRECLDVEIPNTTTKVWKSFMNGSMNGTKYKEEDIQVISGYAKAEKIFSSTSLNRPIQQLLRSKDRLLFKNLDRDFYMNDRVIHVNANCYGMQRYVKAGENTFKAVVTLGMVNGEMGTLVGIVRSDSVSILKFRDSDLNSDPIYKDLSDEDKSKLLENRASRDDIREDSDIKDPNTYFAVVKVYDVDLGCDVYTLYVARAHYQENILMLTGADLGNLDLAYALTTHKMQGSQSPVVILVFGSDCNPTFINRNMLNTMVTRSQGVVCMIGTVKGADSPVTAGRMYPSQIHTSDILSILSE